MYYDYGWEIRVRYQKADGTQASYTIPEQKINRIDLVDEHDGQFAFAFGFHELPITELRSVVCVAVYDSRGAPMSDDLIYSADTYGNGKTGELGDICRALFAYSDSAVAFFAK